MKVVAQEVVAVAPTPAEVKAPTPTPAVGKSIPTPPSNPPKLVVPTVAPVGHWGEHILKSPLIQKLTEEQASYVSKYGGSLHEPLIKAGEKKK